MSAIRKKIVDTAALIAALLTLLAAHLLAQNIQAVDTAVSDGFIAVCDVLVGSLSDQWKAAIIPYAVPLLIVMLTAVTAALFRYIAVAFEKPKLALPFAVLSGAVVAVSAFFAGDILAGIAALIGGFGCIGGILLYDKLQKACPNIFNRETIRYIVFGVLTTVVSFVSQMLFASLGTDAWINTIGSWICAVTFAYIVNKVFVFCSRTDSMAAFLRELWLFFAARLASLAMELLFMYITVDVLHFSEAMYKLIAQVFILVANYILSKLIIFRKKGE